MWQHNLTDEPVKMISAIDSGIERRKIQIYRDGRVGFADATRAVDGFEDLWSRYVDPSNRSD